MHEGSFVFARLTSYPDRNKFNYLVRKYQGDGATHPVKQKQADALGLYDMLGNVAEWTISGSDPLFFTVGGSYESDQVHFSAGMMEMAHEDVALGSLGLRLAIPVYKLNQ